MNNKILVPKQLEEFINGKINKQDVYDKIPNNVKSNLDKIINLDYKKLLIQGDVQSGKTRNLIEYIKFITSSESYFIIFLTGVKNNLLNQNSGRFFEFFKNENDVFGYQKYLTSTKEKINDAGVLMINSFLKEGKTYITSELKRPQSLVQLFEIAKRIEGNILIIDDEADEASLAKNTGSKINEIVNLENVKYLSITATPYKNLYINENFYDHYIKFDVGDGYKGISDFKNNYKLIENNDKFSIEKTIIEPLIDWAHKVTTKNIYNTQILFNFSLIKDNHKIVSKQIVNFLKNGLDILKNNSIINDEVYKFLRNFSLDNILISNSDLDEERRELLDNMIEEGHYIIIGGGNLSRGVTYKNLVTEVMINSPEIPSPGVLLQRARWFGYRKNIEDISIYTTSDVVESLNEVYDLNEWTKSFELGQGYKEKFDSKKYRRIKI